MQEFIRYVILGIPVGCVFGLVAVSLVLTYKTSGVFNLAFAAQAYLAAAVYYDVHVRHEWPIIPAFVFVVLVVSPLVGFLLDRLVFRWLRGASPIGKLVSALGLLVAVPRLIDVWLGPGQNFGITGIWWDDNALYRFFDDYTLDGRQMAILVSVTVVVLLLVALFRWTAIGLQMRAVVESPRLTELAGVNADRASSAAWMLSSAMAGLAGVLLAPFSAVLNVGDFTTLLISAIAAAAFARLTNIPLALLGGILLGIAQQLLAGYLPPASLIARGLKPSLPFAVLFLLLLFWPGLRDRRETTDPLSGADPPPPSLASASRSKGFTRSTHITGAIFVVVVCYLALFRADSFWLSLLTLTLVYSLIFLSITVITGMGGQISLCQATFAGIGAFTTAQLVSAMGSNVVLAMIIGAVLSAAVGALLAIPVLRLAGIYLSLATLAFALMFENVLVPVGWIGGGVTPVRVPRPVIGPFDLSNNKSFFVFCLILLTIVSVLVIFVRRGTTGHYLDALRGSETAAQSIGINPAKARIVAFALSAGIAGLGGGLLAMKKGIAQPADYSYLLGFVFVVVVVSTAARTVEGAINAGVAFTILPVILSDWFGVSSTWAFILFGLGAIQYARHPEGTLEHGKRQSTAFFQRQFEKLSKRNADAPPGGSSGVGGTRAEPVRRAGRSGGVVMSLLEASGITKRFSGITALENVSLSVEDGESVGLIGPNGAGKTTFFNCLLGLLRPEEGQVVFGGKDITRTPVYRRARLGFARTFQRIELFAGMSVRDHLLVAERARLGTGRFWKDVLNLSRPTADENTRTDTTLSLLGLDDVSESPVEALSLGRARLVEVGRALMTEPKLLLLDEPSSGLDGRETEALAETLRAVQAERGTAVLLVEHDVEFVRSFSTRLSVLDFGHLIAAGPTAEVLADDAVRKAYLGELV